MDEELLATRQDVSQALAQHQAGVLPSGYPEYHDNETVVERQSIDRKAMTADFVIVTRPQAQDAINRNGHRVQIVGGDDGRGLVLDHYNTNPVVLWNHGFGGVAFPIARSTTPRLQATKATATAQFSQSLPEAAQIFALIDEGILSTSSISFLPLKAKLLRMKERKLPEGQIEFKPWVSFDFLEGDMLEWSVVDIPADPGAVRKMIEKGSIAGEKISQSLMPSLTRMAGEKQAWSPGWTAGAVATPAPKAKLFKARVERADGTWITLAFPSRAELAAAMTNELSGLTAPAHSHQCGARPATEGATSPPPAAAPAPATIDFAALCRDVLREGVAPVLQRQDKINAELSRVLGKVS